MSFYENMRGFGKRDLIAVGSIQSKKMFYSIRGRSLIWSIKLSMLASLCSFICLQAVYQLSGPVCKST